VVSTGAVIGRALYEGLDLRTAIAAIAAIA